MAASKMVLSRNLKGEKQRQLDNATSLQGLETKLGVRLGKLRSRLTCN